METFYQGPDSTINILVEEDDELTLITYRYLRPFAKQDFTDKKRNWKRDDDVNFDKNKHIMKVLD